MLTIVYARRYEIEHGNLMSEPFKCWATPQHDTDIAFVALPHDLTPSDIALLQGLQASGESLTELSKQA